MPQDVYCRDHYKEDSYNHITLNLFSKWFSREQFVTNATKRTRLGRINSKLLKVLHWELYLENKY